ncbi:hypothetical protein [Candidatus Ichthyocystis hellenicum]|uniref:hypothetical protein n=1 Tax=Candidatus Ichthyocystis hellenicum TaxID=1561003 RepID=UPI000B899CBA|nr:hypothetical protein [Candidatus Ichthyocystis hellenicum]
MDGINVNVNHRCATQDLSCECRDSNHSSLLSQVVLSVTTPITCSVSNCNEYDISLLSLLEESYSEYEFIVNFEKISNNFDGDFFESYLSKCRYKLTKDFLSVINKHKFYFLSRINSILSSLCSSFYFLRELGNQYFTVSELLYKICSSFCKAVYCLKSECIDVLKSDIIPLIIKSIFDSNVIDDNYERKMTYAEMDHFFLHFVISLERSVATKIMEYWSNFYDKNKSFLSSITQINCSNPFSCVNSYEGINAPSVYHPAAFTCKFGEYISFVTLAKINDIESNFFSKYDLVEKKHYSKKYSDNCDSNYEKILEGTEYFLPKEFDKKIIEKEIRDSLNNFLNKLIIWNKVKIEVIDINKDFVIDKITDYIYYSLKDRAYKSAYGINKHFNELLSKNKSRLYEEEFVRYLRYIESKWKINIHPEDSYRILSIRRKFSAVSKKIIRDKFFYMFQKKYKLPNGTVVDRVSWPEISGNLLPIAKAEVGFILDQERSELSRLLYDIRVIEDVSTFDGYYVGTRESTSKEKCTIFRIATKRADIQTNNIIRELWNNLVSSEPVSIQDDVLKKDIGCADESVLSADDEYLSIDVISKHHEKFSEVLLSHLDKGPRSLNFGKCVIIDRWGLNVHPDDDRLILATRKVFSSKIRGYLRRMFSQMLKIRAMLPSGKVVTNCSWGYISDELCPIAISSVEGILQEEYTELGIVLSKLRILDATTQGGYSCVNARVITDDEKIDVMKRLKVFVHRNLLSSIRMSWIAVTKSLKSYACECRGNSYFKLRYSDNAYILTTRKKYASKIKSKICDKFNEIISNRNKFGDGTIISDVAWFRVHKKVSPIAQEEIKYILEDEKKELEAIISKARLVDSKVDRELTIEEKHVILKNTMRLVNREIKDFLSKLWLSTVNSLRYSSSGSRVSPESIGSTVVNCVDVVPSPYTDVVDPVKVNVYDNVSAYGVNLCYEDDCAILSVKRKFSSELHRTIRSKFCEMLKNRYKFSDSTVIDRSPWENLSGRLLPIAREEVRSILDKERVKINDVLSKSKVVVHTTMVTRGLEPEEKHSVLETIMNSVYKQSIYLFRRAWRDVIGLSKEKNYEEFSCSELVGLMDLMETDKCELDNIRLEFVGNLGPIIGEVIGSLSENIDVSSIILDDVNLVVTERSSGLFREGGFFDRVNSLLLVANVPEVSGNYRSLTDKERENIFQKFMSIVNSDECYLIKKRVAEICNM